MVDYPRLLDNVCAELGLRTVMLGPLGVIARVHGTACRDAHGGRFDPTGYRIFDPAIADAVSDSAAIRDELLDGVRRVMVGGLPFEAVYATDPERGTGWNLLRVFAPRSESTVVVVRRVGSAAEGEASRGHLEEFYRLARATGAGFWELRPDTNEMYIDPAVKASLGYSDHDVSNHLEAWLALVDPADRAAAEAALREHMDGRSSIYEVEQRMRTRDGRSREYLVRGGIVGPSTERRRMVGLAIPLTTRQPRDAGQQSREDWHTAVRRALGIGEWQVEIASRELVVDDVMRSIPVIDSEGGWRLETLLEAIHPRDRAAVEEHAAKYVATSAPRNVDGHTAVPPLEIRIRDQDDKWHWISVLGQVLRSADGSPVRAVGVSMDVTDRRHRERNVRRLRRMARAHRCEVRRLKVQLVLAQDAERQRIARELHDDISQRIAAAEILASRARREARVDGVIETLDEIQVRLSQLATDVRRMSHAMSPLEMPGSYLREQLATYGADLFRTGNIDVRLEVGDLPETIPNEIAIGLFRIAQEALWNVSRHARTGVANLVVRGDPNSLSLEVTDEGSGFDPKSIIAEKGMGLLNMKHRVEQFGGTLEIAAAVGAGTKISARIPLPP